MPSRFVEQNIEPNVVQTLMRKIRADATEKGRERLLERAKKVEDYWVEKARELCPVREVFQRGTQRQGYRNLTGKELVSFRARAKAAGILNPGRGGKVRRLRRRNMTISQAVRKQSGDIVLGEIYGSSTKKSPYLKAGSSATRVQSGTKTVPHRSGKGSVQEKVHGYELGGIAGQLLSSRARYNLRKGIGVHAVAGGTSADNPKKLLVIGGALRDSIRGDTTMVGDKVVVTVTAGNQDVNYAKYVEFGTYKDIAQPFLYPAMKLAQKRMKDTRFRSSE